jgi:hypothetical protein
MLSARSASVTSCLEVAGVGPDCAYTTSVIRRAARPGMGLIKSRLPKTQSVIRAELIGLRHLHALGIIARGRAPVLAVCRAPVTSGYDTRRPLHAYRGDVLCLTVRSIGAGAGLTVADDRLGRPKFRRNTAPQSDVAGPYVANSGVIRDRPTSLRPGRRDMLNA